LIKVPHRQRMLDRPGYATAQESKDTFRYIGDPWKCLCPFCLYEDQVYAFVGVRKNGRLKGKGKCPECHLEMYTSSLITHMTLEEFAQWIVEYTASLFWNRCSYTAFTNRLWRFGGKTRFWNAYNEAKAQAHIA